MINKSRNLIVTAASESYKPQLLAFLGSLRCNWPDHPPVRVYDIGLSEETTVFLRQAGFDVRAIPPFVPHWRKHYTWKLWCMNDAQTERVLWIDSGCCFLRPIPEIFEIVDHQGYFALPNYRQLNIEASEEACEGCGVSPDFREGKASLTAAVFAFRRDSAVHQVVREALKVAQTERHIAAIKPWHRHDQAILSLLMYRDISPLILCDGTLYFCEDLTAKFTNHAIWGARRNMHYKDKRFLASCVVGPVSPFRPRSSHRITWWYKMVRQPKVLFLAIRKLIEGDERLVHGMK
jgi:hypothetical protein